MYSETNQTYAKKNIFGDYKKKETLDIKKQVFAFSI